VASHSAGGEWEVEGHRLPEVADIHSPAFRLALQGAKLVEMLLLLLRFFLPLIIVIIIFVMMLVVLIMFVVFIVFVPLVSFFTLIFVTSTAR